LGPLVPARLEETSPGSGARRTSAEVRRRGAECDHLAHLTRARPGVRLPEGLEANRPGSRCASRAAARRIHTSGPQIAPDTYFNISSRAYLVPMTSRYLLRSS
jgi:hypothetical protein